MIRWALVGREDDLVGGGAGVGRVGNDGDIGAGDGGGGVDGGECCGWFVGGHCYVCWGADGTGAGDCLGGDEGCCYC